MDIDFFVFGTGNIRKIADGPTKTPSIICLAKNCLRETIISNYGFTE
jgi:hypothetical protein